MKIKGNLFHSGPGEDQNFKVEKLLADPIVPYVGQIWFNLTENRYKGYLTDRVVTIAPEETGGTGTVTYYINNQVSSYGPGGKIAKFGFYSERKDLLEDGVVNFYATIDGLIAGAALFNQISTVEAVAFCQRTNHYEKVVVTGYSIVDDKTVRVDVSIGTKQVLVVGDVLESLQKAPGLNTTQDPNTKITVHLVIGGSLKPEYYDVDEQSVDSLRLDINDLENRVEDLENSGGSGLAPNSVRSNFPLAANPGIAEYKVVSQNEDGTLRYANNSLLDTAHTVLGVTFTNLNSNIRVITFGPIQNLTWIWVPNLPVCLGHEGELTQNLSIEDVNSDRKFIQVIGTALSPTTIFVRVAQPIFLQ